MMSETLRRIALHVVGFERRLARRWRSNPMDDGVLRVVGTHHKTGTVLMYKVFRDVSLAFGFDFFGGRQEDLPRGTEVWFEDHSRIEPEALDRSVLGVHVVRHPYELCASAYRYHLVCREEWCLRPGYSDPEISDRPEFRSLFGSGRSYQEILRSLPPSEGLAFEICRSRSNIRDMADWDYSDPRFLECRLEDFSEDFDRSIRRVFEHLELLDQGEAEILRIAAAHDLSRWSAQERKKAAHVTNKSQRHRTFDDVFEAKHFQLVRELFPEDLLSRLGYPGAS